MIKTALEEKIEELEQEIIRLKRRVSVLENKKSLFVEVKRYNPWENYKDGVTHADGRKIKPEIKIP